MWYVTSKWIFDFATNIDRNLYAVNHRQTLYPAADNNLILNRPVFVLQILKKGLFYTGSILSI